MARGFRLQAPLPRWRRRGLPFFEGAENFASADPVEDKESFFTGLFVRDSPSQNPIGQSRNTPSKRIHGSNKKEFSVPPVSTKLFKLWSFAQLDMRKRALSRRITHKTVL